MWRHVGGYHGIAGPGGAGSLLFEDSPDRGQQLQNLFLDAKAQLEVTAFTLGTGTEIAVTMPSAAGKSGPGPETTGRSRGHLPVQHSLRAGGCPRA
jgi:hypothetical protein